LYSFDLSPFFELVLILFASACHPDSRVLAGE
jgi:hypothetical protein